ncbi:MAG TPA: autotransporter domain-containing protein [Usitatibacter sp.]|nr:autotransporter domain-containing protein [Usitatibacter sp.]
MNFRKRVLPAVLLSLFAGAGATSVNAQQFSSVVVFGDSLSDDGYFRPVLSALGLPPSLVATLGRFTTSPGPVWSELVSNYYGQSPAASNAGGLIFAQGGARVAVPSASTPTGAAQRPVTTQMGEYLAANSGKADPNGLFAIWAGANDVIQTLQGVGAGAIDPSAVTGILQSTAAAEIGVVGALKQAGAKYIIVMGLPDIGATPAFTAAGPANAAGATQASAGYNTALFTGLKQAGLKVIPIDMFSFFGEIRANPSQYGFSNITTPVCQPFPPFSTGPDALFCPPSAQSPANGSQTYSFADGIHPTTAAHAMIAQFVESFITAPAEYSLLAETPLRTRAAFNRTVYEGLQSSSTNAVGRWTAFAAYDGGKFDIDAAQGLAGLSSTNKAITVGASARISESATLGIALGQAKNDASFGGNNGSFGTTDNTIALFGQFSYGGFYGNGIVSVANINYDNVNRNIVLGPTMRTATSSPSGSNSAAYFDLGYDFRIDQFRIGPVVSVNSQNVTVNAFDESNAMSSNLHVSEQNRSSEVWSIGVHAEATFGGWTPWVRVTADKERKDDPRYVTASPLSLLSGNSYDIPAYNPDSSFMSYSLGVRGTVAQQVGLSIAYYAVNGRSGIKDDGVTGMLSYKF